MTQSPFNVGLHSVSLWSDRSSGHETSWSLRKVGHWCPGPRKQLSLLRPCEVGQKCLSFPSCFSSFPVPSRPVTLWCYLEELAELFLRQLQVKEQKCSAFLSHKNIRFVTTEPLSPIKSHLTLEWQGHNSYFLWSGDDADCNSSQFVS